MSTDTAAKGLTISPPFPRCMLWTSRQIVNKLAGMPGNSGFVSNDKTIGRLGKVTLALLTAVLGFADPLPPVARAAPAPEIEYLYDISVRRQYHFPTNDPVGYGHAICDKVIRGESYAQVMGEVKNEVTPNDEFASNYLVSNAVNLLCPAQIWQLRKSAAGYVPPAS